MLALPLLAGCLLLIGGCTNSVKPRAAFDIPGGNAERGRQALTEYGCNSCHTIPGVTRADATVGPPLIDWADRGSIAGLYPNTPENLLGWIENPQGMAPGSIMPNMGVPEPIARDMSAYLYTLRRNPLRAPWW